MLPENNEGIELIPQILTNNSRDFLNTAEWLIEMGYKEINFNLGCPSKDVVSRGKGSGFLEFPEKLDSADITVHPRLGKDYYRVMWL